MRALKKLRPVQMDECPLPTGLKSESDAGPPANYLPSTIDEVSLAFQRAFPMAR